MVRAMLGYGLWVMGLIVVLSLTQINCYGQKKEERRVQPLAGDSYSWDFGQVKQGEILQHTFILKNDSPKTLKIKEVHTSCGCTVSEIKKKILSPDESAELEVKFNTKDYSGSVQQYIYVHTDNLDNPILRFIIKAEVVK